LPIINEADKVQYQQFANQHILVIGDAMLDHYLSGAANRISPEAPVPVVLVNKSEHKLGGAANVAANLQKLGATTYLAAICGDDKSGAILKRKLNQAGIDNKDTLIIKGRKTTVKTRVLSKKQQLLRFDVEDAVEINNKLAKNITENITALLNTKPITAVVLQDYNKGLLIPFLIENVIELCAQKNIPVLVDPKFQHFFAFQNCTLFKPNLKEIAAHLNFTVNPSNKNHLDKAANLIFEQLNNQITVITLSEYGIYYNVKNGPSGIIKPQSLDVADVSGAGDTVIAALTLGLATNMSIEKNVAIANAAAGIVCQMAMVEPVTKVLLDGVLEVE